MRRGTNGTYDAIGPPSMLDEIAAAVGSPDLERVPVTPESLLAAGVEPWAGPRSPPLWLPALHAGVVDHDPGPAAAAGLICRPVGATAIASLEYERVLGLDRRRHAGLTATQEEELLRPGSPPATLERC